MAASPSSRAADGREPPRIGVLLAIFDFPVLNAGFRSVIDAERDMHVVGEAADPDSLAADVEASGADVVVAECRPGDGAGCARYESIERLRAACPDTRVLAVECRCAVEQFSLALRAGANGFLTREAGERDVVDAVHSLVAGHTYVSPTIVTRMVDAYVRHAPGATVQDPYDTLTDREREVLLLAAMGHTNRAIARSLHLSEQTVHNHRASAMEKLDLHDRVDMLRYSVRRGLLNASNL